MKTGEVYKSARRFNHNHNHRFENVYVHEWEADLFSVTTSCYAYEIEVKISRSDFLADFKKPKHNLFKNYKKGYGILRGDQSWIAENWGENVRKYPDLKDFEVRWTKIKALQINHVTCPNAFYYAMPTGLVHETEIPPYAGLIYCSERGNFEVIRKAPYIHKDPFDCQKMLYQKYVNMSFDILNERREYKAQIERLERENARLQWQTTVL